MLLRRRNPERSQSGPADSSAADEANGLIWVRQGEFVRPVEVHVGLSDGVLTEVRAEGLNEGTPVVIGANRVESDADASSILPHTWSEPAKK